MQIKIEADGARTHVLTKQDVLCLRRAQTLLERLAFHYRDLDDCREVLEMTTDTIDAVMSGKPESKKEEK